MISSVTKLGATALFASVLLSSAIPASATCYPTRGWGHDPDQNWARKKAEEAWRIRAREHGPSFVIAVGRASGCEVSRKGPGLWSCYVTAQACDQGNLQNDLAKHPASE